MKHFFFLIFLGIVIGLTGNVVKGCPPNPDKLYNRQQVLEHLALILDSSIPDYQPKPPGFYVKNEKPGGFFVYDLIDTSNRDLPFKECVNFINNHIYHFTSTTLEYSRSHIAILEAGKVKVFKSVNCYNSKDHLETVLSYLNEKLKSNKDKEEIISRVKNYRRYGRYITIDSIMANCEDYSKTPENPDDLYRRENVLKQLALVLYDFIPKDVKDFELIFPIQNQRAVGFFVYDLTDPSNKQTALNERVNFINHHIYHFAWIDAPYSYSNIAILENGGLKIFKAVNCAGKGDSLEKVISYLNEKLKNDKEKNEILKRVKNYRKYGVYASFNNLSIPQCQEIPKTEK